MRLAITIEGEQNSGKTTTIKALFNNYHGRKTTKYMTSGWQELSLNLSAFPYLKLFIYAISASPSEKNLPLVNRFGTMGMTPEVLIVPLQPSGHLYANSIRFLGSNGFHILKYTLSNSTGTGIWDRFDSRSASRKLNSRSDIIMRDIRSFINSHSLI